MSHKFEQIIAKYNLTTSILQPWHVAIFKGGTQGLVHKTPEQALKNNSIFMRLDHPDFLKNINI